MHKDIEFNSLGQSWISSWLLINMGTNIYSQGLALIYSGLLINLDINIRA